MILFICRELPFQKGDIVYIIRQVDQNWYEGEHHGRVGIFPQSYVEVCVCVRNGCHNAAARLHCFYYSDLVFGFNFFFVLSGLV